MPLARAGNSLYASQPYICRSCARKQTGLALPLLRGPKRALHQRYLQKQDNAEKAWQERAGEIRAGKKQSMLGLLESRGYVSQIAGTRDTLDTLMTEKRIGAYVGIDPTAPSMHVGHLLPLMVLYWMYIHGYHVISLLGGATARVGDPTGRTTAREDADSTTRKVNMVSMHFQLKSLWQKAEFHARNYGYEYEWAWNRELINNNTWLNKLPVTEVLRLLGPGLRMGPMLGKETVRTRMESRDGMSFSEFMYPILQSWDWWHMYHTKNVQIQIGGSDQYGNITAGIDAINYVIKHHYDPRYQMENPGLHDKPMGFTTPLLTTSSGEKFGKSAGNAIWLDKDMTSSFDLYQFFLRTADADVERYLKLFTFIPLPDIQTLMTSHNTDASKRLAQHKLAHEVLCLIHGEKDAKETAAQHAQLFARRPSIQNLTSPASGTTPSDPSKPAEISNSLNKHAPITTVYDAPSLNVTLPSSLVIDVPIARVLYHAGLVASRSEGHRLCAQEGAYVGSRPSNQGTMGDELEFTPCKNWNKGDTTSHIIDGKVLILRVGKWRMKIVKIVSDEEFEEQGLSAPGWPVEKVETEVEEGKEGAVVEEVGANVKYQPAMKPKESLRESLDEVCGAQRGQSRELSKPAKHAWKEHVSMPDVGSPSRKARDR